MVGTKFSIYPRTPLKKICLAKQTNSDTTYLTKIGGKYPESITYTVFGGKRQFKNQYPYKINSCAKIVEGRKETF